MSDTPQLPRAEASDPRGVSAEPARRIRAEINRNPEIEGYLASATEKLIAITDEATAEIGIEAVRIAKQRNATAVDATDVQAADAELNQSQHADQVKAWFFGVGGVLIGVALSAAPTLALTRNLSHPLFWWSAAGLALAVGLTFAAIGFPRRPK